MKSMFALISAALFVLFAAVSGPVLSTNANERTEFRSFGSAGCGCTDVSSINNRLKGVDAVLAQLASESRSPNAQTPFDAGEYDQGLGESIMRTMGTTGGLGSMVIGDLDRFTCDIETAQNLSNVPGLPAGFGGSSCLNEAVTVGLNLRRQACMSRRNPSNQGNDYWEGMRMAEVIRELTDAYTAEAKFLRDQLTRLAPLCRTATRKPTKNLCDNCIHYMFDAKRTLPVVGTIRMWADEMIPFDVHPDRTISGWGTINTVLDTSGSPCRFSGYNGAADFNITGRIATGNLHVTLTPRGMSQRISAAMSVTCPPGGKAQTYPQSQTYTVTEVLRVPMAGQQFTEKRLDVGTLTHGAMDGEIILRLSMKPIR
jgi:hypothetical protein